MMPLLSLLEVPFNAAAIILNIYVLFLIMKHQIMHNNLRFMMCFFFLALSIVALCRVPQIFLNDTFQAEPGWEFVYYTHQIFLAYYLYTIMPLTVERLIATLQAQEYEKKTTPYFGVIASSANMTISCGVNMYMSDQLARAVITKDNLVKFPSPFFPQFLICYASLMILLTATSFVALLSILYFNRRLYSFAHMTNKHSIQQKYQYSENIRTSIQLIFIASVMFVFNVFGGTTTILSITLPTYALFLRQILSNVTAIICTVIPLCAIFSHPVLRKYTLKKYGFVWLIYTRTCSGTIHPYATKNPDKEINVKIGPKSLISGSQLIISRKNEREMYFQALQKSWI